MLKRILILLITSFLLCSCSQNSHKEEIVFSSWGSVTEVEIIKKLISDFEKENPEIKVTFLHIPQNYFQKLHLLFASNTPPDVIFVNNLYLPIYEKELIDLSDTIDKSDFFEKGINSLSIDGKLLAIPRDISNLVIYYNKNIVKKTPKNFEEFDSEIKKLTNSKMFGISYEENIFYAEPFILTLGYDKGIKYYKNLEGKYAPTPSDSGSFTQAQMFLNQKTVFYISGRWMYPKFSQTADFPIGIMVFPGKIYADSSGWAISKKTKHEQASKKFVEYLSSQKSIDYFTETGLIIPARKDSSKNIKEKAFLEAVENSQTRVPDKNYNKKRDMANRMLFNK